MDEIQNALNEALNKYGQIDYRGHLNAIIALHRIGEYDLTQATKSIISNLPYAADDSEIIKYDVRKVDEIRNLRIWR